jgi:hypothetical protein
MFAATHEVMDDHVVCYPSTRYARVALTGAELTSTA